MVKVVQPLRLWKASIDAISIAVLHPPNLDLDVDFDLGPGRLGHDKATWMNLDGMVLCMVQ